MPTSPPSRRYGWPAGADLVAVDDRTGVVGWVSFGPYRGAEADTGELYALYVHPRLIGTGVGRMLLTAVHTDAVTCDFRTLLLWVLRDNPRARRFYELAGYAPDGAVQYDDYDGIPVPEVRYRRRMGT
ncbi:N-acetyltransferase family protein [Streptomyces blastmyceticus]|uniref:GNAT family N-acetyltransferase n=1 Tax=Streptomyces blastmyceticus TaxID=68180 RepID=UPI003CD064AF